MVGGGECCPGACRGCQCAAARRRIPSSGRGCRRPGRCAWSLTATDTSAASGFNSAIHATQRHCPDQCDRLCACPKPCLITECAWRSGVLGEEKGTVSPACSRNSRRFTGSTLHIVGCSMLDARQRQQQKPAVSISGNELNRGAACCEYTIYTFSQSRALLVERSVGTIPGSNLSRDPAIILPGIVQIYVRR